MNQIGKVFIEKTKYPFLDISDQRKGVPAPPLQKSVSKQCKRIDLPPWDEIRLSTESILDTINQRRSIRSYRDANLSLAELSYLLWCTQGVQKVFGNLGTLRTVPSAGARHALETYLLINHVESLPTGIYRYLSLEHQLAVYHNNPKAASLFVQACLGQTIIQTCAVAFIWSAIPYRMKWRYGERAYRYIFLDVGHVAQNLYLSAGAIQCGVCAMAAFSDDDINQLLNLDGDREMVVYLATVGKKRMENNNAKNNQ